MWAAVLLGTAARIAALVIRPLWADEIFTLTLARRPVPEILATLRLDSGPPLHYLVSKLVLAPCGGPGPLDVVVRLVSFTASLLHVPLFVAIGRRLGKESAGWTAATLYALFPLAVSYAAEGRGYALASLLVLLAFERCLALREKPGTGRAVLVGSLAAAALLTHYLALLPLAGFVSLFRGSSREARRSLLLAGGVAAALASLWLPVATAQPRASMAWVDAAPTLASASRIALNVAFGIETAPLWPLSLAALLALAFLSLRAILSDAAASVAALGLLSLALLAFVTPVVLLPERASILLLPFVALAAAGWTPLAALSSLLSIATLVVQIPAQTHRLPSEALAERVQAFARSGSSVCAVGLWGPELAYRMERAGLGGRVVLFPSDVAAHPGWYEESVVPPDRLRAEALALVARADRPELFVLSPSRASGALKEALARVPQRRVGETPLFELVEVPRQSRQ